MSCPAHGLAASRGMLTKEDVDLIGLIVESITDSEIILVVDLGSGSGTTALSVFAAREQDIKVVGIESKESELYWATQAIKNIGRSKDWAGILGDVLDPVNNPPQPINFLMVDIVGNIEKILETWLPRMAPGGAVWIHNHKEPSVAAAIDKLITGGKVSVGISNETSLVLSSLVHGPLELKKESRLRDEDEFPTMPLKQETITVEKDRPPCANCGYEVNLEKNYKNAMRAHMRKHKSKNG